jgi:MFS family permease
LVDGAGNVDLHGGDRVSWVCRPQWPESGWNESGRGWWELSPRVAGWRLLIGGLGILLHSLWLLYLGYGVIGGCGLGLGYVSPVSTLIKWFPDRRGMATGLAIMGFGGGAIIGSPLKEALINISISRLDTWGQWIRFT